MRSEEEIWKKIAEIEEVNRRRKKPSPERIDISSALRNLCSNGKHWALHDWEEKKKLLKFMERYTENGKHKYCRYGRYGTIIPGDEMDSNCWKIAAYSWALEIKDPEEMKMKAREKVRKKIKR